MKKFAQTDVKLRLANRQLRFLLIFTHAGLGWMCIFLWTSFTQFHAVFWQFWMKVSPQPKKHAFSLSPHFIGALKVRSLGTGTIFYVKLYHETCQLVPRNMQVLQAKQKIVKQIVSN